MTAGSPSRGPAGRRGLGVAAFVALQAALLSAAVAWGAYETRGWQEARALPPLRPEPLEIPALYDDPAVVSDQELRDTLSRLALPERGEGTVVGHVDHALRFWGAEARFDDPDAVSGEEMRSLLTNQWRFVRVYGVGREPLLVDDGVGVRVRAFAGPDSASHVDHTLASLAEVGTPLDFPVLTSERRTTFRDVIEQSLRDFSLNQPEYEWSTLAFALYLPPVRRWTTSEGQVMTFDRLARRIMREALPEGVCSANHRLYALVALLRIDDRMAAEGEGGILEPGTRRQVVRYLRGVTATLVRHQHPDGFWNDAWPRQAPASSAPTGAEGDRLSDRLIVTGHVMEWWALAPREVLPPRSVRVAAGRWLVRTIAGMTPEEIQVNFSFLSHAGRALALWRGHETAGPVLAAEPAG